MTWSRAQEYPHVFCLYILWINSWRLSHLGNWKQLAHHFCSNTLKTLYGLSVTWVWCVTSYSLLSMAPPHLRALWTTLSFLAAHPLRCLLSLMSPLPFFICLCSSPVDLSTQDWTRGASTGQESCLDVITENTDTWDIRQLAQNAWLGPSLLRNLVQWTEARNWKRGCISGGTLIIARLRCPGV